MSIIFRDCTIYYLGVNKEYLDWGCLSTELVIHFISVEEKDTRSKYPEQINNRHTIENVLEGS